MDDLSRPKILALTNDRETARRWAEMLGDKLDGIWLEAAQIPEPIRPDVILTDQDPAAADYRAAIERFQPGDGGDSDVAVVRVGDPGPADVHLPHDVSAGELRLACQLTARIARLRSLVRHGIEVRHQLSRQALTDPLTGLSNRRAWDAMLRARLAAIEVSGDRLCVAIFDLDRFKQVNDDYGHNVGDDVLRAAGRALREGMRHNDMMARLGGDEFALLVEAPSRCVAQAVVERVRRSIVVRPAGVPECLVTASAGFYVTMPAPAPLPCPEALVDLADRALRQAKQQGRNRTVEAAEEKGLGIGD
jgi:diguanylate cyclase (GGDEF)-like protein